MYKLRVHVFRIGYLKVKKQAELRQTNTFLGDAKIFGNTNVFIYNKMNWELKLLVIRNKKEIYFKKNSFIKYVILKNYI